MEKGLLFLTLSMFCLWGLLDEFFGGQKISAIALKLTPGDQPVKWIDNEQAQADKEKVKTKIDKDKKLNSKEKKYFKGLTDEFYGPGPA